MVGDYLRTSKEALAIGEGMHEHEGSSGEEEDMLNLAVEMGTTMPLANYSSDVLDDLGVEVTVDVDYYDQQEHNAPPPRRRKRLNSSSVPLGHTMNHTINHNHSMASSDDFDMSTGGGIEIGGSQQSSSDNLVGTLRRGGSSTNSLKEEVIIHKYVVVTAI